LYQDTKIGLKVIDTFLDHSFQKNMVVVLNPISLMVVFRSAIEKRQNQPKGDFP